MIQLEDLNAIRSLDSVADTVRERMSEAAREPETLLRFLARFTSWNSEFGPGVATLAGKIGRCRRLFRAEDEPFDSLADRSTHIASHIFEAARDEFDDSATDWLDTHRTLAQAFVKGMVQHFDRSGQIPLSRAPELLKEPMWLHALIDHVSVGYGDGTPDDYPSVFRAIGFHLGSEILADKEFSTIDGGLRAEHADLVKALLPMNVQIAGQPHKAYHWLAVHSDLGGGVEMEHFESALEGARLALRYAAAEQREGCRHQLLVGFREFASDHDEFFGNVNT